MISNVNKSKKLINLIDLLIIFFYNFIFNKGSSNIKKSKENIIALNIFAVKYMSNVSIIEKHLNFLSKYM